MKRKLYFSSIAAAAIISTVLTLLPYKHYDQVGILGGVTPNLTSSIADFLREAFTGNYTCLVFLTVFFPMLILPELSFSCRHNRVRFLFPIQGFLLLGATFLMWAGMKFDFFETNTKFLPTFYGALVWVSASAIFSFLLVFKKIRNLVGTVFSLEDRPKQLQLI